MFSSLRRSFQIFKYDLRQGIQDLNDKFGFTRSQTLAEFETRIAYSSNKMKQFEKIEIKLQRWEEIDQFFIQFANSAQSNGRVNGQNLTFVIAPEEMGKTTYVQTCLQNFERKKRQSINRAKRPTPLHFNLMKSPEYLENQKKRYFFDNQHFITFNFNFAHQKSLNFEGFLALVHEQIIAKITKKCQEMSSRTTCLLDSAIIFQVVTTEKAPEYIFIYLKDVMFAILNGTDPIELSSQAIKKLQSLNQQIIEKRMDWSSFIEQGCYNQLIRIICTDKNIDEVEAALKLMLSVGKRIDFQHRPPEFVNAWYQSGIEATNILFDVLNYMCGLGQYNRNIFEETFFGAEKMRVNPQARNAQNGLIPKSKPFYKKQKGLMRHFQRIDVLMCILNISQLSCYGQIEFLNWFDHVISRLDNHSNLRTHFPIMIELPDEVTLYELQKMGQMHVANPVVLELPGYIEFFLRNSDCNLGQYFTDKMLVKMFQVFGRIPHNWNKAILQMSKGATFNDIKNGRAQYLKKQAIVFEAKLNALFTDPAVLPQILDGTAYYELMRHLKIIKKVKGMFFRKRSSYDIELFNRPIFQAMHRVQLVYQFYYNDYLNLNRQTDLVHLIKLRKQWLKKNWLGYVKWNLKTWPQFLIRKNEIKYTSLWDKDVFLYRRFMSIRYECHLHQTYYGSYGNYLWMYASNAVVYKQHGYD